MIKCSDRNTVREKNNIGKTFRWEKSSPERGAVGKARNWEISHVWLCKTHTRSILNILMWFPFKERGDIIVLPLAFVVCHKTLSAP